MSEPACLYALIEAGREQHDAILARGLTPLAMRWRAAPELSSLFFVRYSEPTWQLRFRVLGAPSWIERTARPACEEALAPLLAEGVARGLRFATYERELERYGGEAGMHLAERLFHLDSLACLDWLALERAGTATLSRREFAMATAEVVADGFAFSRPERAEFYRQGYSWAFDSGLWGEPARALLEQRFEKNRAGLDRLLGNGIPRTGSPEEWAVLLDYRDRAAPAFHALREGLAREEIKVHPPYLAWSLAHMGTNRLGIDPAAEAILRFMAGRRFARSDAAGMA
jgi:thiopeptide-type bacteriocin biosynthesis protein